MKDRNLIHSNDWATPPYVYDTLKKACNFDFDPCPFNHDMAWDGLTCAWGKNNFVNPPYSRELKEAFVERAVSEMNKGNRSVLLLPVSTSTKLFHDVIKPNASSIDFVKGRIAFIGINTKGEYVNWHLWDRKAPDTAVHVKNSGMHDSMLVFLNPIA